MMLTRVRDTTILRSYYDEKEDLMGLGKRIEFDHSKSSAYEAAGYSLDTVARELEPRAALLANQIVAEAGTCPTMAVDLLMDSLVLSDSALDNRDRVMIVLMAGRVIASALMRRLMTEQSADPVSSGVSKHGFDHLSGKEQHVILRMTKDEWDKLVQYAENQVLAGPNDRRLSRLVENMEQVLERRELNTLQTAVLEAFVARQSAMEAARQITPSSAVIGPLATVGRP